jgi:Flp pilus assembly protein TadG
MFLTRMHLRGQILPFVALLLVVLLGFAALAADVGYLRYQQRIQQSATDSAALAGAAELLYGTDYRAAAKADAARNGFADGVNGVTVTPTNPPATGNYTADTGAVQVTITSTRSAFFMKVLGRSMARIATKAVATGSIANNDTCLYLLNPSGNGNLNGSTFNGPDCGVVLNTNGANLNNATFDAASIEYSGSAPNINGASFPKATPRPAIAASDPCLQIPGCAYLTNNPPSTTPCTHPPISNGYASAGCYGAGTDWRSVTNLNSGVYIINGDVNASKANITGNGVTIYFTSNGSMNLDKATLNLSAMTTGSTAGVLFYSKNTSAPNFNQSTNSFTGVVYFPNANVNYNKAGGGYQVLIFGGANFNKNSMNFTGASTGGSYIHNAVLVE